jgi:Uma2 family endonuclease
MSAPASPRPLRMTADEFIAWAMQQPKGRYELVAGEVVARAPERASHTRTKHLVWLAFREVLRARRLPCETFGDGMSVRIDETTLYEPDTLVRCGNSLDGEAVECSDPVIVVEVVSPSSQARDTGAKLEDYFRLPSMRHYLIVKTETQSVTHHAKSEDGRIETRVQQSGQLHLDPPGITVAVESFFEG